MTDRERAEVFKEYLRKWDFELFPLMPIAEADANYLLEIFDQRDRNRETKHRWYLRNREDHNEAAKNRYHEQKAQAFIKGANHD